MAMFSGHAGRSRALTLAQATGLAPTGFSVLKHLGSSFAPQSAKSVWVSGSFTRIDAVVRAGPRSGPRVWEIQEYHESRDEESVVTARLESIAAQATTAGALRILLRTEEGDDIIPPARRAGYLPHRVEQLYQLPSSISPNEGAISEIARRFSMRPRVPADDNGLFRLYCAVTPVEVRTHAGMTADEWSDGLEAPAKPDQEWVWEREDRIAAWLSTTETEYGRYLAVAADESFPHGVPALVECGVAGAGSAGVVALVPSYEYSVSTAMEMKGFVPVKEYQVLAKPLAERVKERAGVVAVTR